MAADLLLYDADLVPVGKDQKQHVEMARDMAGAFNAVFGPILKLPQPVIKEDVMTVPGIDGRKMSKSYNNVIPLFGDDKQITKSIMSIPTDSTPVEDPKSLTGSLLGTIISTYISPAAYADFEQRLQQGGLGWGHVKAECAELLLSDFSDLRKKYFEIRPDTKFLESTLASGAEKVSALAEKKIHEVRTAIGLR